MNEVVAIARRPTFEQLALTEKWERKISDSRNQGLMKPFSASLALQVVPSVYAALVACLRSRASWRCRDRDRRRARAATYRKMAGLDRGNRSQHSVASTGGPV